MSNNEVCMRLEGGMTINVDAETISLRRNVFKMWETTVKMGRARQLWYILLRVFECYSQILISRKETRH